MVDLTPADFSNFKWFPRNEDSNQESSFVVLDNNTFSVYQIVEAPNTDLRKQDVELSLARGTLVLKSTFPPDTHHHNRKYKNFIVHPLKAYDIITACQQKLYYIHFDDDFGKADCVEILNLDKRSAAKRINLLDWNHINQDTVAFSVDKFRTAKSIHIADITKKRVVSDHGVDGEGVQSMAWSPHCADLLVAGTSKKRLELFDTRVKKDSGRKSNDIQETEGVCFSPQYEHILASHSDEYVKIWDSRLLKNASPVYAMKSTTTDILNIQWCPTHPTRLSYITKGGKHIQIRDFSSNMLKKSEGDQVEKFSGVVEQEPQHKQKSAPDMLGSTISSFSWHPRLSNKILCCKKTVDGTGVASYKLYDIALHETIIAKFTPTNQLVWGCAGNLVGCALEGRDIAETIQQRIEAGYSFNPSLNKRIVGGGDSAGGGDLGGDLAALWSFFEAVQQREQVQKKEQAQRKEQMQEEKTVQFKMGIQHLINSGPLESRREKMAKSPQPFFYTSKERNKCLEICSWPIVPVGGGTTQVHLGGGSSTVTGYYQPTVDKLLAAGEHYKSVAMILFYAGVDSAIEQLQKIIQEDPEDDEKRSLLIALSGFNDDKESLWYEQIMRLGRNFTNPYQRAMFTFLTAKVGRDDAYDDILTDRQLFLEDRLAFACRFLPDSSLQRFINTRSIGAIAEGHIRAVVLTGVTYRIHELMQNYLDQTSDVQTVCLALTMAQRYNPGHYDTPEPVHDAILENYLQFFDMRCMWIPRARFQNERKKLLNSGAPVTQHLTVRCNGPACFKSISDQRPVIIQRIGSSRQRSSEKVLDKRFCPSVKCKSPLPRCSLCMHNLGTTSRHYLSQERRGQGRRKSLDCKNNPLRDWFVWCLECKHGGHADHVNSWFQEHKLCPVPDCECKCRELDMCPKLESVHLKEGTVALKS